jgi:diguanylate cyclase (GGDEF)-like protein
MTQLDMMAIPSSDKSQVVEKSASEGASFPGATPGLLHRLLHGVARPGEALPRGHGRAPVPETPILRPDDDRFKFVEASSRKVFFFTHGHEDPSRLNRGEQLHSVLYEIAQAVHDAPDLPALFRIIYRALSQLIHADNLFVALCEPGQPDTFSLALEVDETDTLGPGAHHLPGSPTAYVARAGQPLLLAHGDDGKLSCPEGIRVIGLEPAAWLGVPLVLKERVIGVVAVMNYDDPHTYSAPDVEIMEYVSRHLALAIDRKQVEETLQKRLREMELLNRVMAAVTSTLEPTRILTITCSELAIELGLPQAAVALLNDEASALTVVAEYCREGHPPALGTVIPVAGNPSTEYVLQHRLPLQLENAQTDPRTARMHEREKARGTVSLLIVPLVSHDRVIGTLGLNAIDYRLFTAEEIALAQNVAAAVAQRLENARLYAAMQGELLERRQSEKALRASREALHYLAYHDALTRLPNRALFYERLRQALARAARSGQEVVLLYLDLDNFKEINDTFGHDTGDLLLQEVAARLSGCLRQSDTAARIGGDEFTIILQDVARPDEAAHVAEKILDLLASPFTIHGKQLSITASIGLSTCPAANADIEEIIRQADLAMYRSKDTGKNSFHWSVPSPL